MPAPVQRQAAAEAAAPAYNLDLEARPDLDALRQSLQGCERCKLGRTRTSIVFGTGDADARLMFVGEAPGRDEDLQGEPFVGEAGRLLDRMIAAMGLSRQSVYIANIVKCRPPRNRDPQTDEVMSCEPFLRRQIAAIQPDVVVGLGRFAAQTLLCDKTPINVLRGKWRQYGQTKVMPTFHPAYLLHNPGDKKLVWQDLQHVMAQLGLDS
jgi:DNA polymerase